MSITEPMKVLNFVPVYSRYFSHMQLLESLFLYSLAFLKLHSSVSFLVTIRLSLASCNRKFKGHVMM